MNKREGIKLPNKPLWLTIITAAIVAIAAVNAQAYLYKLSYTCKEGCLGNTNITFNVTLYKGLGSAFELTKLEVVDAKTKQTMGVYNEKPVTIFSEEGFLIEATLPMFKSSTKLNVSVCITAAISQKDKVVEERFLGDERTHCEKQNHTIELYQCISPEQCKEAQACSNNTCIELNCGECAYIASHNCVKYECCSNADCGEEETCEERKCVFLSCKGTEEAKNHSCVKKKQQQMTETLQGILNKSRSEPPQPLQPKPIAIKKLLTADKLVRLATYVGEGVLLSIIAAVILLMIRATRKKQ